MTVAEEARKYAVAEIEKFGTPILEHFLISEKKALELAKKLQANEEIVQIGIYFMDLKLGEAHQANKTSSHVDMGVRAAREFFKKYPVDDESGEKIINCIAAHHGAVLFNCLEAEICANADCYRFIHPKGFFAYLMLLGQRGLGHDEALDTIENKLEEKHKILSLEICKKELEPRYQQFKKYIKEARNF